MARDSVLCGEITVIWAVVERDNSEQIICEYSRQVEGEMGKYPYTYNSLANQRWPKFERTVGRLGTVLFARHKFEKELRTVRFVTTVTPSDTRKNKRRYLAPKT